MNPYVYQATCGVCGEVGMVRPSDYGSFVAHDPWVCAENLKWKRRKEAERQKLEASRKALQEVFQCGEGI